MLTGPGNFHLVFHIVTNLFENVLYLALFLVSNHLDEPQTGIPQLIVEL